MESLIGTSATTLCEMLEDRGYNVDTLREEFENLSYKDMFASETKYSEFTVEPDMTIFYCLQRDSTKATRPEIERVITALNEGNGQPAKFILVVQEKLSSNMIGILEGYNKELEPHGGAVQWFNLRELQFNPSKHVLVPKHIKLSEDELKQVLTTYKIKNRFQLPHIQRTDVMARYLGLRHGDVVMIQRLNQSSGVYTYYRCCA